MKCVSCNNEINSSFKFALAQNKCPYCGVKIIDEKLFFVLDSVEQTILNEFDLGREVVHSLALALVLKYNIGVEKTDVNSSAVSKQVVPQKMEVKSESKSEELEEEIKINKSNTYKEATKEAAKEAAKETIKEEKINIIEVSKILSNNEINDDEKERILEQVVKEKYNLIPEGQTYDLDDDGVEDEEDYSRYFQNVSNIKVPSGSFTGLFNKSGEDILEQERQLRLQKKYRAPGKSND